MPLQITNSLSRRKEVFVPLIDGEVRMYVCGPTVYNFIHIGNARPLVFFDVVRRYLEFRGYKVTYVMNFTDVEDKIINRAREEKTTAVTVANRYAEEFCRDRKTLQVRPPDAAPRVSTHIPPIIRLIEGLVANNSAYVASDGEVFFSVRGFPSYGKLSGKNIDDLLVGARVAPDEKKRDPLDFSLWKPQKAADEPFWESPWGKGRPGWHIECSAMAMEYLGQTFDIHGGGMDLMHPHHENEIAQSEALTHKPFVKYWMHNNMLCANSEKMSKSLGNFFLTREFLEKYGAETLKYLLLSGHYRSTIDFSEKHIRETQAALHRFYSTAKKCDAIRASAVPGTAKPNPEETKLQEFASGFAKRWQEAMDDDFNTAKTVGIVFEYVRMMNAYLDKKGFRPTPLTAGIAEGFLTEMKALSGILNILGERPADFLEKLRQSYLSELGLKESDLQKAINDRAEARAAKDFKTSDAIRDELLKKGIELRDLGAKTEWDLVFGE